MYKDCPSSNGRKCSGLSSLLAADCTCCLCCSNRRGSLVEHIRIKHTCTMLEIQAVLYSFSVLFLSVGAQLKARNCSEVRKAYTAKGFSEVNVPPQEISATAVPAHLWSLLVQRM
ncbi:hypothetical protein GJAV_G00170740 [Gymnothorax javanicus]|nr:hypothetical protein GJAV_G00170740 [Gymnothorax javanicus]